MPKLVTGQSNAKGDQEADFASSWRHAPGLKMYQ